MQGTVLSIEDMKFNGDTLVVDAIIEDAVLTHKQTLVDPPEWGPGLCRGTLYFPADFLIPATDRELMQMLSERVDDWALVDVSDEEYPDE